MPPPNQTRFDAGRFAGRMFPLSQEEIDSMNGRQMLAVLAQMALSTASVRGSPRHHEGTGISPRAPTRGTDDDVFPATRRAADGGGGGPWSRSGPLITVMPPPNETRFDRSRGSGLPEQSVMSEPEGFDIHILVRNGSQTEDTVTSP